MQKTLRSLTISGVAVVLSLTSAQPLLASAKPGTVSPNAAVTCESAPLINSYSVDGAGKKVTAGSSSETARKAVYRMNGENLVTTVPPADFNAATASQTELARAHIPARPSAGPRLELWKKIHAGPKHRWVVPDHLCLTNRRNTVYYSQTHSGLVSNYTTDTHNAWWDAGAMFTEPTFNAVCPSASSYSMWPGIGDDTHLIQAGTEVDADGDGPNDDFAWYELIGPKVNNAAVEIPQSDFAVSANDQIWVEVTYDDALGQIEFDIANITTGDEYFPTISTFAGHDAHFYYSGDSLQLIAERATQTGPLGDTVLQLRQPQGNKSSWQEALGNRTVLNYPADFWDMAYMTSDGESTGTTLSTPSNVQASGSPSSITWQDDWYGCS